jgi:hypothetical protein
MVDASWMNAMESDATRRVTTHWAYTDLLSLVGATYEKARIVRDGNLITAGGVTAGIDFGLSVVAEIAGEARPRQTGAVRSLRKGQFGPSCEYRTNDKNLATCRDVGNLVAFATAIALN